MVDEPDEVLFADVHKRIDLPQGCDDLPVPLVRLFPAQHDKGHKRAQHGRSRGSGRCYFHGFDRHRHRLFRHYPESILL